MTDDLSAAITAAVKSALLEDLGPDYAAGDITTTAVVGDRVGSAAISANQSGIIAGLPAAAAVFDALGTGVAWRADVKDGDRVASGQVVADLSGNLKIILEGERTALNFLSHLSGIATLTRQYVEAVAGTEAVIYDTRKTTPGQRLLEKYAVTVGGGRNHRLGLFDAILIKDNHLVGRTIGETVAMVRAARPDRRIEIEVETISQLVEAIEAGVEIVLMDNMDQTMLKEAVAIAKGKVEIEVSGGINLDNVGAVAAAGAERISVGAITQGAPPLDFSLAVLDS